MSLRTINPDNVSTSKAFGQLRELCPRQEATMVFDKTDTKLSSFINEASAEDLSGIASQVFSRVSTLDQRQQERFIQEIQRDPQAKRVFEQLQSYSR
jgi:hypothetical protein